MLQKGEKPGNKTYTEELKWYVSRSRFLHLTRFIHWYLANQRETFKLYYEFTFGVQYLQY